MRVVCAPASLKGVLDGAEAAAALARGVRAAGGDAVELPVADGGEGTAAALAAVLGGAWREADAEDPLGRPLRARWLLLPDGTAAVDSAAAVGLPLLDPSELDPLRASSRGLGLLLRAVLAERPAALLVGLGGSATVDGGAGMRSQLGRLDVPTRVACDVRTALLDAPRLFGPQKGASPAGVAELERRLAADEALRPYAWFEGSGAAGGLGAAFAALGAELVPGARLVLETLRFRDRIRGADLVVTGEGAVDATTAEGKAPAEVARVAAEEGVRCLVFGGRVDRALPGVETVALSGEPARARDDLVELGRSLAA
ncbi:MAG TPA: glycerate kinase [Gaiellaceae bacterium]|nr:glycerate kinase [Gaiellaceae bacterium]